MVNSRSIAICFGIALVFMTMIATTGIVNAETTIIDFEDLDHGSFVLDHYDGLHFSDETIVYKGTVSSLPPLSGEKVLTTAHMTPEISINFDMPVSRVGVWYRGNGYTAELRAHDSDGDVVDLDRYGSAYEPRYLEVNGSDIRRVVMHTHRNQIIYDYLEYDIENVTYVFSSDSTGVEQNVFTLDEDIYCYAENLPTNVNVDIYIVSNKAWSIGDVIGVDVSVDGVNTVTTDGSEDIAITKIWPSPLTVGKYDIVVDVNQNGYLDSYEPVDDLTTGEGVQAIPEFPTIALPIIVVLGMASIFQRRRG